MELLAREYEKILDESDDQHLALATPLFWLTVIHLQNLKVKKQHGKIKTFNWDFFA